MTAASNPECRTIRAENVKRGMILDLELDPYADPDHDRNPAYEYEYAIVESVAYYNDAQPITVVIEFRDGSTVGFPSDHNLYWTGEQYYQDEAETVSYE